MLNKEKNARENAIVRDKSEIKSNGGPGTKTGASNNGGHADRDSDQQQKSRPESTDIKVIMDQEIPKR